MDVITTMSTFLFCGPSLAPFWPCWSIGREQLPGWCLGFSFNFTGGYPIASTTGHTKSLSVPPKKVLFISTFISPGKKSVRLLNHVLIVLLICLCPLRE
jgi:hypothetical protein